MALSGREKATILLSILGTDLSQKVMKFLPNEFADLIAEGIDHLPKPSQEAITSVLNDLSRFMALAAVSQRKVISEMSPSEAAQYPAKTQASLSLPGRPAPRNDQDVIFYSQPKKLAIALSAERVPTVAFVLSYLPPMQAEEVISFMSERRREIELAIRNIKKPPIAEDIRSKIFGIIAARLARLAA